VKRHAILAAALLGWTCTAGAFTGNELWDTHQRSAPNRNTNLLFYVQAIMDSQVEYGALYEKVPIRVARNGAVTPPPACAPDGATYGQAYDIAIKYVEESPSVRHLDAHVLVLVALRRAWPCPTRPVPKSAL
jgi:hypothetical protein